MPLLGFAISAWPGGSIQGYGVLLLLGVVIGLLSLACQFWMTDVNPQIIEHSKAKPQQQRTTRNQPEKLNIFQDINFLKFLLYLGLWMFAINLSAPFFNLYMMQDLALDLGTVTLYTSLVAGANLVMLVFWGRLADRIGNRPLLLLVGILIALTPLFWLFVGSDSVSVWVWLPLIHLVCGGFGAATDLCITNIQMSIASATRPSQYYAIAAAVAGTCGGLGSAAGGYIAGLDIIAGLTGLFALSAILRLLALIPLVFVQEPRSQSIVQLMQNIIGFKPQEASFSAVEIAASVD